MTAPEKNETPAPGRRDVLALMRTDLANERTLLAYGRTALMVCASGLTLIKFFPDMMLARGVGWGLTIISAVIGIIGMIRFKKLRKQMRQSD
jgi:putative membrane protein